MKKRLLALMAASLLAVTVATPAQSAVGTTREIAGGVTVVNETALADDGVPAAAINYVVARYAND